MLVNKHNGHVGPLGRVGVKGALNHGELRFGLDDCKVLLAVGCYVLRKERGEEKKKQERREKKKQEGEKEGGGETHTGVSKKGGFFKKKEGI